MKQRKKPSLTHLIPQETIESKILYIERFPDIFMFQLTDEEKDKLVTKCDRFKLLKHSSSLPHAFTEQGVAMLSSILKSKTAIQVNIQIMITFTKLREIVLTHKDLQRKIDAMERKYDQQFKVVFDAMRKLLEPPPKPKRVIGFRSD